MRPEHRQIGFVDRRVVDEVHPPELDARQCRGRGRVCRAREEPFELQQVIRVDEAVAGRVGPGIELGVLRVQHPLETVGRAGHVASVADRVVVQVAESGPTAAGGRPTSDPLDVRVARDFPRDHRVGVVAVRHAEEAGLEDVSVDLVGGSLAGVHPREDRGIADGRRDILEDVHPVGGAVGRLDPDVVVAGAAGEGDELIEGRLGLETVHVEHVLELAVDGRPAVAPLPVGPHSKEVHPLGQQRSVDRLLVEAVAIRLRISRDTGGGEVFEAVRHIAGSGHVHRPAAVEVEPLVDTDHRRVAVGRPVAVAARERDRLRGQPDAEGVAGDHLHIRKPGGGVGDLDRGGLGRGFTSLERRWGVAGDHGAHPRS